MFFEQASEGMRVDLPRDLSNLTRNVFLVDISRVEIGNNAKKVLHHSGVSQNVDCLLISGGDKSVSIPKMKLDKVIN